MPIDLTLVDDDFDLRNTEKRLFSWTSEPIFQNWMSHKSRRSMTQTVTYIGCLTAIVADDHGKRIEKNGAILNKHYTVYIYICIYISILFYMHIFI